MIVVMATEPTSGRAFLSDWAASRNLRHVGDGLRAFKSLIDPTIYDEAAVRRHYGTLEHAATFGAVRRLQDNEPKAIAALTFPYLSDGKELREAAQAFADEFDLAHRVGHPDDRVYNAAQYTPIAFWRVRYIDFD